MPGCGAESGDEPVGELAPERFFESRQCRRPIVLVVTQIERLHVCEKADRAGGSHLREKGGAHATGIVVAETTRDPWRE